MKKYLTRYFNFIKKLIPAQPDSTFVGLDISQDECRLIEIRKEGKTFRVVRSACEPIQGDQKLDAVKNILAGIDLTHTTIHSAIQGKGTLIRHIEMPRMSIEELRNSFALEADKYFPFASDQIYTDCFILDPQGKAKHMEVMAVASTKDLVDQRLSLVSEAGFQADSVTINSIAVANIFNVLRFQQKKEEGEDIYVLVDIGAKVSSVTIMADSVPKFSRDIFIGTSDFVKRITNTLGIDAQEARKLFLHPGAKEKDISSACDTLFQNMAQEIRLSLDYFSTEKNKEVARLVLTGEAANGVGVQKAMKDNLDVNVEIQNLFEKCEIGEGVNGDEIKNNAQKYSVALGLALLT